MTATGVQRIRGIAAGSEKQCSWGRRVEDCRKNELWKYKWPCLYLHTTAAENAEYCLVTQLIAF